MHTISNSSDKIKCRLCKKENGVTVLQAQTEKKKHMKRFQWIYYVSFIYNNCAIFRSFSKYDKNNANHNLYNK